MTLNNEKENKKKKLIDITPSDVKTPSAQTEKSSYSGSSVSRAEQQEQSRSSAARTGLGSQPLTSSVGSGLVTSALPAAAGLAGAGIGLAAAGAGAGISALAGTVGALVSTGEYIKARKMLEQTMKEEPRYEQSDELKQALEGLKEIENSKPGEYRSAYEEEINSLLTELKERPEFSYDFTADPLYHQYREQYIRNGRLAMEDTVASASALTGGYANSWASTSGDLAFQSYLSDLNSVIPELEERAFDHWKEQGNEKLERVELLSSLDSTEYGRWQDAMDGYYRDLEYAYEKAQTLEDRDWKIYLDELEKWGFKTEYYDEMAQNAFGRASDSVGLIADSVSSFGKSVSDSAWSAADLLEEQRQFNSDLAYKRDKAALDHSEWQAELDRTLERDERSDYEWDAEFGYKQERAARDHYEWDAEFGYKRSRDAVKDEQWQAELNEKIREFDYKNSASGSSSSSSSSSAAGSGKSSSGSSAKTEVQRSEEKSSPMSEKEFELFTAEVGRTQRDDEKKKLVLSAYSQGRLTKKQYETCLEKYSLS